MLNIVMFGPPGSGKGTQSEKIIDQYGLVHLSTGDLLRSEISGDTPLGRKAARIVDQGKLVPDEIVIGMIRNQLDQATDAPGFIFDGFPRTADQARSLDRLLEERDTAVSVMISLDVEREELIKRLLKRGKESGRSDDNLEVIENRIRVYHEQTSPVMDYYRKAGKFESVNGTGSIEEIFERLVRVIDSYR